MFHCRHDIAEKKIHVAMSCFFLDPPSHSQALKGRLVLGCPREQQTSVRPVLLQLSTVKLPRQSGVCPAWNELLFQGIPAWAGGSQSSTAPL